MPQVRYLGFAVGDATADAARSDARMGHFLATPDPLPVGTLVEIDGQRLRITRVDEGASPGFWTLPAGAAIPQPVPAVVTAPLGNVGTPRAIDAENTDESPPPVEMTAEPADADETPPEDGTPEPVAEGPSSKGKGRKRKNRKTVVGR